MSGKKKKSQLSKEDLETQEIEEKRRKEMAEFIGKNIQYYRLQKHFTRELLAEKSHITASHLYQLEIGNSIPSIITIIDICNALEISIAQLVDNLLNDSVNRFSEIIRENYNNLSEKDKNIIIKLISFMSNAI